MIWVKNNWFPFGSYNAITIWPFVFYKKINLYTRVHEEIHGRQQKELLVIPFYLIYFLEYLFKGYHDISFEKEAYDHQSDPDYLNHRKCYAMWRKNYVQDSD